MAARDSQPTVRAAALIALARLGDSDAADLYEELEAPEPPLCAAEHLARTHLPLCRGLQRVQLWPLPFEWPAWNPDLLPRREHQLPVLLQPGPSTAAPGHVRPVRHGRVLRGKGLRLVHRRYQRLQQRLPLRRQGRASGDLSHYSSGNVLFFYLHFMWLMKSPRVLKK